MVKTQDVAHGVNTCRHLASVDLGDRCRPMVSGMVLHMLERATDHDGTICWPIRQKFSEVVLADRLQPQRDYQQHATRGITHAGKIGHMAKT